MRRTHLAEIDFGLSRVQIGWYVNFLRMIIVFWRVGFIHKRTNNNIPTSMPTSSPLLATNVMMNMSTTNDNEEDEDGASVVHCQFISMVGLVWAIAFVLVFN